MFSPFGIRIQILLVENEIHMPKDSNSIQGPLIINAGNEQTD